MHLRFAPGDGLLKHITPVDVCFYVLEGQATIEIGDRQMKVDADTLVESPARIPHRILNESEAPVRVLVIKTPAPNEPTRFVD
jgi:mannose-6-phosphate isomerase-like protein (cupin superfamily)